MQVAIKNKLSEFLAYLMGRIFLFADGEQALVKLFRDDRALDRALNFTSSFVTLGNVLGDSPRTDITMWLDSAGRNYPVCRSEQWDAGMAVEAAGSRSVEAKRSSDTRKEHPVEAIKAGRIRHNDIQMVSLVRESLWEEAKWKGTAFSWTDNDATPPVLAPWFENAEAAKKIFAFWRKEIGEVDKQGLLRVAIIRGISRQNVNAYRVVLGVNPAATLRTSGAGFAVMVSRVNTMEASSSHHLDAFLANYKTAGAYWLGHCLGALGSPNPELVLDDAILKRELHLRNAWEIGKNDLDGIGVLPTDDPVIPADHPDAPVLELLRWKQER
jgi:hypothetical protein